MPIAMKEKPIFVLGSERSGTTLFMCLLGFHPRIAVPEVGWLYPRFYPFLYTYGDLSKPENLRTLAGEMIFGLNHPFWGMKVNPMTVVDEILGMAQEPTFAGIYHAMHERFAKEQGRPRWGQKTPHNIFFAEEIKKDFPNAQFIYVIRDGRDVAVEMIDSAFHPKTAYTAAQSWALDHNTARPLRQKYGKSDWLDVRYEELVRQPEKVLREVCAFLGEEYSPKMLDFYKGDIAKKRGNTRDNAPLAEAINDKYVGIYKRLLSIKEQEIFAAVAGKELEEAGYKSDVAACKLAQSEVDLWLERDGRIRAALLDSPGGHIVFESYRDWLAQQREDRRKKGIWHEKDRVQMFPPELEDHVVGVRASMRWKQHFSVKSRFDFMTGVQ